MEDMIDRSDESVIHEMGWELCSIQEPDDISAYEEGLTGAIAKRLGKPYVLLVLAAAAGSYETYAADRPIR